MKPVLSSFARGMIFAGVCIAGMGAAAVGPAPNLHSLMKNIVSVQTQVIWDIGNNAQNEEGDIDPKKLKAADWNRAVKAAETVKMAAQTLAKAERVLVAEPGQTLHDEGEEGVLDRKTIQKIIDSDPKAFASFARSLANVMDETIMAAKMRDTVKFADVSGRLDEVCESCHVKFWYPTSAQ